MFALFKEKGKTMWSKRVFYAHLIVILLCLPMTSANALTSRLTDVKSRTLAPDTPPYSAVYGGFTYNFTVRLDPSPPKKVVFNSTEMSLLTGEALWSKWKFRNSSTELPGNPPGTLPGTFDVVRYDAGLAKGQANITKDWDDSIKDYFEVDYNNSGNSPPRPTPQYKLVWIQFVYTNYPLNYSWGTDPSPAIDPTYCGWTHTKYEDGLPFYHNNETEISKNTYLRRPITNPPGKKDINATFLDAPTRSFYWIINDSIPSPVWWRAHLYLAWWNQTNPGDVIIFYEGLEWGFDIEYKRGAKVTPNGPAPWDYGGVAGDKLDFQEGPDLNSSAVAAPVGGISTLIDISVGNLALLTPYIALDSTIIVAAVAAVAYVKHIKRKEQKQ
jgi:hypothetical protein